MTTGVVIDTSAIAAVLFGEDDAELYASMLVRHAGSCELAAPTLVESQVVVESRFGPTGADLLATMIERISPTIVAFDAELAVFASAAWRRFGKGRHPARLNLGDCFSYALAKRSGLPLLFKGADFAQTDVASAL